MELKKEWFWEAKFEEIDKQKHKDLIIQRVVDFGMWEDFLALLAYYGRQTCIQSLMKNTELTLRGVYFASHFFNKKLTDFTCYTRRQSIPIRFPF